jgi:NAD(P)-dependent dehydrogenase (short-subunit alcohol dehydrogenase family)
MKPALISLVTGANKGIGLETARQLGALGHSVLVGARNSDRGARAVAELTAQGLDARHVAIDVSDVRSVASAAEAIERDYGRLDVLVNNAGIGFVRQPPSQLDTALLREVFETNFFGAFEAAKAFLPLLRRSEAARIVNVSSTLGSITHLADPHWHAHQRLYTPYSISKAALNAFTALLSAELIDTTIKVNAVEPGYTPTDMTAQKGVQGVEEAARVVVRYATLNAEGPTGGYFEGRGRIAW